MDNLRSVFCGLSTERYREDRAADIKKSRGAHRVRDGVAACRMGAADDPLAVTDPSGLVYGVDGLTVCDASLFPCVPRANTNIPTIMCAEKIADDLLAGSVS